MLKIDKQNQLISLLKETYNNNENYILQSNFLYYLKTQNLSKKNHNLQINLYDKENCVTNLPPHIYDIAKTALIRTFIMNKNVSIIFNGGSQSGKTYNLYKCLEYFAKSSFNKNKNFNCDIIDSINVMVKNLCCIDDITEIPLLYKVNVSINKINGIEFNRIFSNGYNKLICFNRNTKNFNIFYTVFYGIEENNREKFGLQNRNFFLLNEIKLNNEEKEYCKNQFNKLKYCMIKILGFTEEHFETFLCVICAILNIGNISFYVDTNSNDKIVKILQKPELLKISTLLEIPNIVILNIFHYKNYDNSIEKALHLRDQLIEMLYTKLIDWVLMRIQNIYENKGDSSIYLFDYKGYTSSNYNEYDEFCTNITNEIHMNLFLSKYIGYYLNNGKIEKNITLTKKTNESCLHLLINGKKNLLGTLNDECVFPLTSTSTLIKKFDLNFIDQNCYLNSRSNKSLEFGIKHFFGVQYYNVSDFLLQNRRINFNGIEESFLKSQNSTIISMFGVKNADKEERFHSKFMATEVVNSLNKDVISKLTHTEMIFVCCLKTSLQKNSVEFDSNLITKQLKSQGLLDLLKLETNNFNHKYNISQFLKLFHILIPINCIEKDNDIQNIMTILNNQHIKFRNDYIILDKKVYLTENLAKNIEWKTYEHKLKCIIKIQALFRSQIERRNFLLKRKAAIKIQSYFRRWKGKKVAEKLKNQIEQKLINENVLNKNNAYKYLIKSVNKNTNCKTVKDNEKTKLEFEEDYVKIPNTQDIFPINQIPIEDFAKKYIKYHQLGVKREAIISPFLEKDNENDYCESLKIFKLILEYILSEDNDTTLINSITEIGINNTKLRDEIYIQLLNQTYNNVSKKENDRILILFLVILNSFLPSNILFSVLKDYFISQKQSIQILLNETFYRHLSISQQQSFCRKYPSITTYEMIAFTKKQPLCIKININKIFVISVQIDSLSTIKEIIKCCLEKVNLCNINGWNIDMEIVKNKLLIKLEEKDYLFDIIYMIENGMIDIIKEVKFTYPTNIKRLKNEKESLNSLEEQLVDKKNKVIINEQTNDNNIKQVLKTNDLILSPRTLRRIYIFDSNDLSKNTGNEREKTFDDNNNNSDINLSVNQLIEENNESFSKFDENGNDMEYFNVPKKSTEKEIYSSLRYMPIMEVDDDVQDMIDNIFQDAISENKDNNLIKSSIEKTLIKNIQGGLIKENNNEEYTYIPYKEHYEGFYDLETSSSLNNMSKSQNTLHYDTNNTNNNSSMPINNMELKKLICLGEVESSICGNNIKIKTSENIKSKDAIVISSNLYNITLRKELFYPHEIPDKYEIDLIYLQIINDCKENNPYRIEKKERDSINKILRYNKISLYDINEPEKIPLKVKDDIVNCARGWPLYFSKIFFVTKINDDNFQKCQLRLSEKSVYVVEVDLNSRTNPYTIIDTIFYDEICDTYLEDENIFYIYLYNNSHFKFLTLEKSEEIKSIINKFLNPILEKPIYLHAIAPFLSNNIELLSFNKGDQIQVINDNYYHKSTIPNYRNGWLFGKCNNSVGWFSTDYVSMTLTEDGFYVTPYFDHQQVSFSFLNI
ncbi:Unconventional myosin-XV [Strongyloides ratti]|uniref:Unconventional myosin-XV n=1 Tax=Strongyloides ratti TaxID=34506 RepID=A0A090KR49_STRRB|nr:Unconventional myosin-XV [Strongyloides ratti]CEF59854.1 Unconventional myosin-XV [Strongyloides ratti]